VSKEVQEMMMIMIRRCKIDASEDDGVGELGSDFSKE
jgi:hypothetical protein